MTPANYGSVFSCCLFGSLMMLYLYVFCRSKRFILRNGTFVIYLAVGVVMIRMLLPWNFHFAANVESHKILPFLFDLLRVKILSVEKSHRRQAPRHGFLLGLRSDVCQIHV